MGPLAGIRVIELAGLGPAPFAAMLLADLGADVVRVDRPPGGGAGDLGLLTRRSRRSLALDLKKEKAVEVVLDLVGDADVLLEGFRPGVAERLGFGPEVCLSRNPRLVYGRVTGWGQTGPLAARSGHDLNYVAVTGVLDAIGPAGGKPVPPLNLVGDLGGGAMYLIAGVLAALYERDRSGRGQVVDAAIVDGVSSLMSMAYELRELGFWNRERGHNLLDGGCPFYDTYLTADGRFMAVGALEPKFFAIFIDRLGIDRTGMSAQYDRNGWPEMREQISAAFAGRNREEWIAIFQDTDACVSPVLSMAEALEHPHLADRSVFVDVAGSIQPGPAPRFSRSTTDQPTAQPAVGEHTDAILDELGFGAEQVAEMRAGGIVF